MNAMLKISAALVFLLVQSTITSAAERADREPGKANPVLPGY